MLRLLAAVIILLAVDPALAQEGPRHRIHDLGTVLASTALSGGPVFTITNPGAGFAKAVLTMNRTRSAGTDMTMTCTQSRDGGTTKAKLQTCEFTAASGTCTHYDVTWKSSTSSSEILSWEVTVLGQPLTYCTLASTSADTDTIVVTGMLVTQ
jgi:hypothetical protein